MRFIAALVLLLGGLTAATAQQRPSAGTLVDAFVHAWNTHDGPAFGRLYADDADWVMANGERLKGAKAIEAALAKEHASWARTTDIKAMDIVVRELGPDRAIVMFAWEITSDAATSAARRGNTVLILTRPVEDWIIVAGQVASGATTGRQPIIDVHRHASWPGADDAIERDALLADMDAEGIVLSLLSVNEPGDLDGWLRAAPGRFISRAGHAVPGDAAGAVLSLLRGHERVAGPHLARTRNSGGEDRNPRRDAVRLHGSRSWRRADVTRVLQSERPCGLTEELGWVSGIRTPIPSSRSA